MNPWYDRLIEQCGIRHDKECADGGDCPHRARHIERVFLRFALIDHVDTLTARMNAVRELVAEFEAEDIMPVGQVTLIRAALDGD